MVGTEHYDSELEEKYWWFVGRRLILRSLLDQHADHSPTDRPPQVLEVGCGAGGSLNLMSHYGSVVGTDTSMIALTHCRHHGKNQLIRADGCDLPFDSSSFDLVSALDVIEHIRDDKVALSEMHRVLKPHGLLALSVPAFKSLWSDHDIALAHYRRYRRRELKEKVESAGLRIVKLSFCITTVMPGVFLFRNIQKLLSQNREPREALIKLPTPINALLVMVLAFESMLLRWMNLPFGVSLTCLATK